MEKFRKKPVVIEAEQWFTIGDMWPIVKTLPSSHPAQNSETADKLGWVETLEGGHIVSPGDWIIKGVSGEYYPCKPDIFEKTYERVENVS